MVNADALRCGWNDHDEIFDFVVVDFPDPTNYALGKLYSTAFYRLLDKHLAAERLAVIQATSPLYARQAFWCVVATLEDVGLPGHALPRAGALLRRMGLHPRRPPSLSAARALRRGHALPQPRDDARAVPVPQGHGAGRGEVNRLNNQIPGAQLRAGVAPGRSASHGSSRFLAFVGRGWRTGRGLPPVRQVPRWHAGGDCYGTSPDSGTGCARPLSRRRRETNVSRSPSSAPASAGLRPAGQLARAGFERFPACSKWRRGRRQLPRRRATRYPLSPGRPLPAAAARARPGGARAARRTRRAAGRPACRAAALRRALSLRRAAGAPLPQRLVAGRPAARAGRPRRERDQYARFQDRWRLQRQRDSDGAAGLRPAPGAF